MGEGATATKDASEPLTGTETEKKSFDIVAFVKHSSGLIFAVVFFMICSSGMLLVNKAVMNIWDLPITVTIIQMAFCAATVGCSNICFPGTVKVGKWADARRWALWVPFLFALMLASSMLALSYCSTGAVVVTRNIAPLISLPIEAMTGEKVAVDVWTVLALVYTLGGVYLYMVNDVQFSLIGFLCIIFNMASAVAERLVQRRLLAFDPVDCSKMALVVINNTVAILPVALFLLPATKEYNSWEQLGTNSPEVDGGFLPYVWLVLSCVAGIAIGYAGINAQMYLTATSFMVLGNVNKFIVIGVGIAVMGESASWQAIVGCTIAITGGLAYAVARNNLTAKQKAAAAAAKKKEDAETKAP